MILEMRVLRKSERRTSEEVVKQVASLGAPIKGGFCAICKQASESEDETSHRTQSYMARRRSSY
jgi:hypothetical protein